MKVLTGIRIDPNLKEFLKKMAERDHRSLSSFFVNAAIIYSKEKLGFDWHEEKKKK